MDDQTDGTSEALQTDSGLGTSLPPHEKVLPVIFYGALVIWAVSVVITIWNWATTNDLSPGATTMTRLQLVVSAVGSTWGYLLVAVIALVAKELLQRRD